MTSGAQIDVSIAGMIFEALRSRITDCVGDRFNKYVVEHQTDRWLIYSDYVLRQPGRSNDVFAFTVMPGGDYWSGLTRDFLTAAKRDFKDIKAVDARMARLLRDPRLFSFAFVLDPLRVLTQNVDTVRGMLDRNIARLNAKPDRESRKGDIAKYTALRRKAAAGAFNVRLFDDIIVASTIAAFLTFLICDVRRAGRVGWFSDRDGITTAYDAIANHLYATNVNVFCGQHLNGWTGPALGVNALVPGGESLWCDPFIRAPDYFAGVVSAWDLDQNTIPGAPAKYQQMLMDGVAGVSNVRLMRLIFKHEGGLFSAYAQSLNVIRNNTMSSG